MGLQRVAGQYKCMVDDRVQVHPRMVSMMILVMRIVLLVLVLVHVNFLVRDEIISIRFFRKWVRSVFQPD